MIYLIKEPTENQDFLVNELKTYGFTVNIENKQIVLYCDGCQFEKAQNVAKNYGMLFIRKDYKDYYVFY